jgi:hypothetical protein
MVAGTLRPPYPGFLSPKPKRTGGNVFPPMGEHRRGIAVVGLSSIDQGRQVVFTHQKLSHVVQVLACQFVYAGIQRSNVLLPTVVQETLAEIYGEVFAIVTRHTDLPFELLFRSRQSVLGKRGAHHFIEFLAHKQKTMVDILLITTEVGAPQSGIAIAHHRALHGVHEAVMLAQAQVQPGIHAGSAQNVVEQIEGHAPWVMDVESPASHHDVGLMGMPGNSENLSVARRVNAQGWQGIVVLHVGSMGREIGRGPLEQRDHLVEVDIARYEEDAPLGAIVAASEPQRVGRCERTHELSLAQYVVSQGMTVEDDVLELVVDKFRRRIVVALYLVANHFHLLVNLVLGIDGMEDDVGEQVHGPGKMSLEDGRVVDGVLLARECVEVAAHALQAVQHMPGLAALRSLEGDVLAKMGQSLLALLFVTSTAIHLIATIHYGR